MDTTERSGSDVGVKFKALTDADRSLDPAKALSLLSAMPSGVNQYETARSEAPVWTLLTVSSSWGDAEILELPSKHAQTVSCWKIQPKDSQLQSIGSRKRNDSENELQTSRPGFGFRLSGLAIGSRILCVTESVGPARLSALIWSESKFYEASKIFDRSGGFLYGGMIMLALMCAAIAVLNRDRVFALFAVWMVLSLRLSAFGGGWDFGWLSIPVSIETTQLIRKVSISIYAYLAIVIFETLFKSELSKSKVRHAIPAFKIAAATMVFGSILLPYKQFLILSWSVSGSISMYLMIGSIRVLMINPSVQTGAYALAWVISAAGTISEIVRASTSFVALLEGLNVVSASIASTALSAFALADRMRIERIGRMKAEKRARMALHRFKENYNSVPVGLVSLDLNGEIQHANPAFLLMFEGLTNTSKTSINKFFAPAVFQSLLKQLDEAGEAKIKVLPKDSAEGTRAFSVSASLREKKVEASIQDITKEYEAENRMKRLAHYDTLTEFLNRRGLEKAMTELAPSISDGTALTVAFFDLDKFKLINDLYGYQSGDEVIKEMGRRLGKAFRPPNVIAHVAGDEFVVLMVGSDGEVAKNLCRFAVSEINERSYHVGEKSFKCNVSVGLASVSETISAKEVFAYADRACREAKASQGDDRIVLFDPNQESYRHQMGEVRIESQMGQDLPLDRFFIEAQPIVSLQSPNANFNYEVLVRMKGENGETVAPAHFLKAVERNGLMSQLDRFVLRSTLEWLNNNPAHVERLTYASVNLSGASLNDHRFLQDALAIMHDYRTLAPKICFEITESVALGDISNTRHFTERVKAMGCFLALDDFGAGYTSFQYMKEFPADVVKIDGAYVKSMRRRSMDFAIVRAITDLSHEIGMSVVAEWAETPDLISSLARLGVDYGQGWALGKPMAMDRLLEGNCAADFVPDQGVRAVLANPPKPEFRKPNVRQDENGRSFSNLVIPGIS